MPNVIQCFIVTLRIFNQDVHNKLGLAMLFGQIRSLLVVATLPTHGNGCIQIKLQVSGSHDELFQLLNVFKFSIAIEQESGVVGCSLFGVMQFFQVQNQVVYPLCIQKLNSWSAVEA